MRGCLAVAAVLLGLGLSGQNLIRHGDFLDCGKTVYPECRTNGGKASLFTEEYTWNRCGKLEITQAHKDKAGHEILAAAVYIGGDMKTGGFVAKPNTRYRFSLDVKGGAPGANISAVEWYGDRFWYDMNELKSTVGSIKVQKDWTRYSGSFTTGPKAIRAALCVKMWHSTQYGPQRLKIGDYVLFDNVVVEENKLTLAKGTTGKTPQVKVKKATCAVTVVRPPKVDGRLDEAVWSASVPVEDFVRFKKQAPVTARTQVRALFHGDNVYLGIDCQESQAVAATVRGQGSAVWNDDLVEIFFAPRSGDRVLSQFVVCAGGGRYMGDGSRELKEAYGSWEAKSQLRKDGWSLEARIPLKALGWQKPGVPGETIGFNVCRQRRKAGELSTWNVLRQSFHEPDSYGELVLGSYGQSLQANFGVKDAKPVDRQGYENTVRKVRQARLDQRFADLGKAKFRVAPVSVTSDFAVPFLPDEIFSPVDRITLTAAMNEHKALPLAIANLTDQTATYRVILETVARYNGDYGLAGFPPEQIEVREAIRFKASDSDAGRLRLDPLPLVNQTSMITIPPKEGGLVWFDFNTSGVTSGTYAGRIRIIPLSEPGTWESINGGFHNRKYTGDMQDIPISLEVRDIPLAKMPRISMGFFQPAENEAMFKLMTDLGASCFGISPWSFQFPMDKDGNLNIKGKKKGLVALERSIDHHLAWGRKYQVHPTFFIGFSSYLAFENIYGDRKHPEVTARRWQQWLQGVQAVMNGRGVPNADYILETWDEPDPKIMPQLMSSHQLAKAVVPTLRLSLTLSAKIMSAADMEKLSPVTDDWDLWRGGYFSQKDHLEFIRKSLAQGKTVTHYSCSTSMEEHLDRYYRRHAWIGEYYNLSGNTLYYFNGQYAQYGTSDYKITQLGGVAYKSFNQWVPSIRYMALREGITDVKYLDCLRRLAGEDPQVKAFLKKAARQVVVDGAHDPATADKVREEAAQMILKLRKQGK